MRILEESKDGNWDEKGGSLPSIRDKPKQCIIKEIIEQEERKELLNPRQENPTFSNSLRQHFDG